MPFNKVSIFLLMNSQNSCTYYSLRYFIFGHLLTYGIILALGVGGVSQHEDCWIS